MNGKKNEDTSFHLDENFFQRLYNVMTGIILPAEDDGLILHVSDEFAPGGLCADLYEQAYEKRLRISGALGDGSGENRDLLALIEAYEKMQYALCSRAFEYGIMAAGAKRV